MSKIIVLVFLSLSLVFFVQLGSVYLFTFAKSSRKCSLLMLKYNKHLFLSTSDFLSFNSVDSYSVKQVVF